MHCGFSLCLCLSENFIILEYVYMFIWSFILIEMGILHLHSCTDFRISETPLTWHTKFVSICIFLGQRGHGFHHFQKRGCQMFNIDSCDYLLLAFFWSENILLHAGLSSLSVLFLMASGPLWPSSPQRLFRALRNGKPRYSLPSHYRRPKLGMVN